MGVRVRERPPGSGVWWVYVSHRGRRKAKKVGSSKKAALDVARKIEAKLALGDLGIMKEEAPCPTFREHAERWLALPHDWKESTRENYGSNLRLHAYPAIGKARLDQITRRDLKELFDRLLVSGKARGTVKQIRTAIGAVLGNAVEEEIVRHNPLANVKFKFKSKNRDEIRPLTDSEAKELLGEARNHLGGKYYPSILCALRTGMRIGEIEALKWGDVDFAGGFVEVRRSHRKGRVTDTKTHGKRRVDMSPMLAAALRELKASRKVVSLEEDGWVFADGGGRMLKRKALEVALHRCLEKVGLRRIRVHDLRHTYATIRLLRGHNIGDVSKQLGHSSIKITFDVYGHWVPGKFKSEVAELDQPEATGRQPEPRQRAEIPTKSA